MQKALEQVGSKILELETSRAELEGEKDAWEEEKITIADTQKFGELINLNVGGMRYTVTLATLTSYPDSMLGAMFSGRHTLKKTDENEYFIDRSGRLFCYILEFLQTFEIDTALSETALKYLKKEALYFGR